MTDHLALRPRWLIVALLWLVARHADASEITFRFSGTISDVVPGASQSIPGGLPEIGSSFAVWYSFDPATPDDRSESDVGEYQAVSELRLLLESSGTEFLLYPGEIPDGRGQIQVNLGSTSGHRYNTTVSLSSSTGSISPDFGESFAWVSVGIDLVDEDFVALQDDSLPVNLPFAMFDRRSVILEAQFQNDYLGFLGQIESYLVIPEPSSGALLAIGLLAMQRFRRSQWACPGPPNKVLQRTGE